MREKLRYLFCSLCVVGALAVSARAGSNDVSLTLVPFSGLSANGGQSVLVEAYFTTNTATRHEGGQWDVPCIVPGSISGTMTATEGCTDCNMDGSNGNEAGTIPFLFGPAGLGPHAVATCITATTPAIGAAPPLIAAGVTRYIGAVRYLVSDCAAGAFDIAFQCTDQIGGTCDNVPEAANTTRYREDVPVMPAAGPLLSLDLSGVTVTVATGTCCDGTSCLCDNVNAFCCANQAAVGRPVGCGSGSVSNLGQDCLLPGGAPNPIACACTADVQCDNGQFCDGLETCNVATGQCAPGVAPVCPGTTQCTTGSCDPAAAGGAGACVVNNNPDGTACAVGGEGHPDCDDPDTCLAGACNENLSAAGTSCNGGNDTGECDNPDTCDASGGCQANNVAGGCTDDGNQCTDDVCAGGACTHPNDNSNACSDGLACTTGDACSAGNCAGAALNCDDGDQCTGDSCVEPIGCVNDNVSDNPCLSDADCAAVVPGAVCVAGFCACNPCIGHENGFPCDDGDPCTQEACYAQDCVSKPICDDDGDPCTNAACTRVPCCDNESPTGECLPVGGNGPNSTGHCGGPTGALCQNDLDCTICEHIVKEVCDDVPQVNLVVDKSEEPKSCFEEGEKIDVDVVLEDGSTTFCVAGGQFRIEYDPSCLEFNSASAGDAPWTQVIFQSIDESNGVIFIAVGVPVPPPGGVKCAFGGVMARLSFNKIGKCNECDLCLSDLNPMHTRLTSDKGDELDPVNKCSNTIRDDRPATIDCPPEVEVNSECDSAGANVSWSPVIGHDQCDGDFPLDCTCEHIPILVCRLGNKTGDVCQAPKSDGDECVLIVAGQEVKGECVPKFPPISDAACNALINTGGFFPQGRFIFNCSNLQTENHICPDGDCLWTVRVSDHQSLDVKVQLSPVVQNNAFNRCICFEGFSSCSPEVSEETCVDMTFGGAGQFSGKSDEGVKIKKGKYVCLTARDRQHSLRSTDFLACDGVRYSADFSGDPFFGGNWLIQGNLNRDPVIDILDFGTFIGQLNQNPNPKLDKFCDDNFGQGFTHADFNGDGNVDVADFTFIQINFLEDDKNSCCPDSAAASPVVGLTEVSVKDLRTMGLGDLAVADLNGDGLVNTDDMASYLAGSRPKANGKGTRGNNGRIGSRN